MKRKSLNNDKLVVIDPMMAGALKQTFVILSSEHLLSRQAWHTAVHTVSTSSELPEQRQQGCGYFVVVAPEVSLPALFLSFGSGLFLAGTADRQVL